MYSGLGTCTPAADRGLLLERTLYCLVLASVKERP